MTLNGTQSAMKDADLRAQRREALKVLKHLKEITKYMEKNLRSQNKHAVAMACAFFHIIKHHIIDGDLRVDEVNLAKHLRMIEDE